MRSVFSPSSLRIVFSADGLLPLVNIWRRLRQRIFDSYHPELHYMADVAERGQEETIVAWVGPIDFYRRAVGAEVERTFIQLERPAP